MKLKQPFGPSTQPAPERCDGAHLGEALAAAGGAASAPAVPARRQSRRELEELKMQVLELAEHQMEITVRVLRLWIAGK